MRVDIDPYAGFCFGVKKTIELAEDKLISDGKLVCLGEIVHNPEEINRLKLLGLQTIDRNQIEAQKPEKVLIRSHGEPPSTYELARKNKLEIIEGTCPVVRALQKKVNRAWKEVKALSGQVVICGKANHPEIVSLNGHIQNEALIINKESDVENIDFGRPIRLFAQTTFNAEVFQNIIDKIREQVKKSQKDEDFFQVNHSICHQVTGRIPKLADFCLNHDVIIFVSGPNSSNGKFLYKLCKSKNHSSYFVSQPKDLKKEWYKDAASVGISGATSTPVWLLEEFSNVILDDK